MRKLPFMLRRRHNGTFFILSVIAAGMLAIMFEMVVDMGMASFASDQAAGATDLAGYTGTHGGNSWMHWVCDTRNVFGACTHYTPYADLNVNGEDSVGDSIVNSDVHIAGANGTPDLQVTSSGFSTNVSNTTNYTAPYHVTTIGNANFTYKLPYSISGVTDVMHYHESTTDTVTATDGSAP